MVAERSRNFWTGVLYLVLGGTGALIARTYGIGTAASMGAGYFPSAVGMLLAAVGGYLMIRAVATGGENGADGADGDGTRRSLGTIVLILASILAFALLVPRLGFLVAVMVQVFIAGLASGEKRWKEMVMVAITLPTVCTLIFIVGLGLSFPILPTFLTR
ncbi:MAG: tripartite tricarboxylate transporter TctB family protein [Rhodobacteraceae bacterium]|nr:tripartite tricarboxylate transporter TctB family protein [Paracoccaceae bacterium]